MTRDARAALLAGVATLMALLALQPVMADRNWLQPVVLVVAAVTLAGAGSSLAGLPRWTSFPLMLLTGAVITTALLVPAQATLGGFVPTRDSVGALVLLAQDGLARAEVVEPPATSESGIVALLTMAAAAVTAVTVLVAGPLRRPGAAGLPLLLVVCVAAALSPEGIGLVGFLGAALGYLGLTLVDADERVRTWGQVLTRRSRDGRTVASGVTEHLVSAAAVTAAVAVGLGAVAPLLVPGVSADRLQRQVVDRFGSGSGDGPTSVNPFLDIREDLESQDDTVLIRYATTTDDPDPLRIVTADRFDGAVWAPREVSPPQEQDVSAGLPAPPGAAADVLGDADRVSTSLSVGGLAQRFLPLPYPAAEVDVPGRWLFDERTLNVLAGDGGTTEGLQYQVVHYDVRPDAATLEEVPPDGLDPLWTELPDDVSDVVVAEAQRVTADAGTRYEQALALQQWFRNTGGFTYSLDAPDVTDRDAVEAFLEDRRGYCVQFSSTMALMARSLGIPARVAVGFLPGQEVVDGQWEIRADDAHAWPELYFEGVGWVRFEPTPATRTGAPPEWAIPRSDPAVPQPSTPPVEPGGPQDLEIPEEDDEAVVGGGQDGPPSAAEVLRDLAVTLLALGGLVLLASVPRLWRWWRHRRRVAAADGDAAALAVLAWTELLERLADLDALPDGTTARTQARALLLGESLGGDERLDGPGGQALGRLVEAWERALYAPEPAPVEGLHRDVRTVLASVRARRSRGQRFSATWLPTPSPVLRAPRVRQPVG